MTYVPWVSLLESAQINPEASRCGFKGDDPIRGLACGYFINKVQTLALSGCNIPAGRRLLSQAAPGTAPVNAMELQRPHGELLTPPHLPPSLYFNSRLDQ